MKYFFVKNIIKFLKREKEEQVSKGSRFLLIAQIIQMCCLKIVKIINFIVIVSLNNINDFVINKYILPLQMRTRR